MKKAVESKLETLKEFAYFFLSTVGIVSIIYGFMNEDTLLKIILIASGLALIIQGIVYGILFESASEIIKLLKKINGLQYDGEISGTEEKEEEVQGKDGITCSKCGAEVKDSDMFCTNCGEKFTSF